MIVRFSLYNSKLLFTTISVLFASNRSDYKMTDCHDMKKGQVYMCEDCGLELTVTKECEECEDTIEACGCAPCKFICCGEPLALKE